MSNDVNKLKQRLEIRKYLVFAGMFLLFLGAMWLIFAPSEEEKKKEEKNAGFNTELPDPKLWTMFRWSGWTRLPPMSRLT